jgi:phage terminase small subunit
VLTAKQFEFVRQYLVDFNATRASIRAGYSAHTASEIGYENLRKPQIRLAIHAAFRDLGGITATKLGSIAEVTWDQEAEQLSGDDLVAKEKRRGTDVVSSRVTVLPATTMDARVAAAIESVQQGAGGELKVKMHDKVAALDRLARALGIYQDKYPETV